MYGRDVLVFNLYLFHHTMVDEDGFIGYFDDGGVFTMLHDWNSMKKPIIICGDMNIDPNSEGWRRSVEEVWKNIETGKSLENKFRCSRKSRRWFLATISVLLNMKLVNELSIPTHKLV